MLHGCRLPAEPLRAMSQRRDSAKYAAVLRLTSWSGPATTTGLSKVPRGVFSPLAALDGVSCLKVPSKARCDGGSIAARKGRKTASPNAQAVAGEPRDDAFKDCNRARHEGPDGFRDLYCWLCRRGPHVELGTFCLRVRRNQCCDDGSIAARKRTKEESSTGPVVAGEPRNVAPPKTRVGKPF